MRTMQIRMQYYFISSYGVDGKAPEFRLEIHINPQCIYIESELEIQDVINMSNVQYHL